MIAHGKLCPEPYCRDEKAWQDFLEEVKKEETKEMLTLDEALLFLHEKGLLDKTDHWKYMSNNVKDLEFVFIKWANSLATRDIED